MASSTDYVFVVGGCLLKRGIVTTRRHKFVSGSIEPRHFRNCKTSKWRHGRQLGISAKSVSRFDPLVYGRICRRKTSQAAWINAAQRQRALHRKCVLHREVIAAQHDRCLHVQSFACRFKRRGAPATCLLVYEVRGWQARRAALPHHATRGNHLHVRIRNNERDFLHRTAPRIFTIAREAGGV